MRLICFYKTSFLLSKDGPGFMRFSQEIDSRSFTNGFGPPQLLCTSLSELIRYYCDVLQIPLLESELVMSWFLPFTLDSRLTKVEARPWFPFVERGILHFPVGMREQKCFTSYCRTAISPLAQSVKTSLNLLVFSFRGVLSIKTDQNKLSLGISLSSYPMSCLYGQGKGMPDEHWYRFHSILSP